ncbi:putative MFS allantoate transporter [Hortaea werneckii]|nr:putative MFS allantoate transporter [Hortaea werneckii]KAI7721085.1 putative MFS allantoate transporter [Hortaea werneckii]
MKTSTPEADTKSHSNDVQEVLDYGDSYTEEEERAVVRKIDLAVLPMICGVFFLQYLDKQSLSYAGAFELITDLGLTNSQYSWCSSIFYVGQLVSEFPIIYLLSRLHLTKFVGATIILWGGLCMCLAAPQNFAGFAAVRFLLGIAEGAVSPAFVTITSVWYRKGEHASRTALWISMNGLAQIVGCLLMYGIGKNGALNLQPWRVLFLVCGAMTVAAGVGFYLFMPNGPNEAWFLNARQKHVLSLRMVKDREGGDKTSFSSSQLKETVKDVKAWFAFWFGVLVTMQSPVLTVSWPLPEKSTSWNPANAFTKFASLVIKGLGYDKFQTLLNTAPSGAVQIAMLWLGILCCTLLPKNRTFVAMALCIPPLVGNVFLMKLTADDGWGMIVAAWISSCITAPWTILLSLTASNVKGNTKRSIVNTAFFIGYCAGCIASPQLWTDRPRYFEGVVTSIVTWCLLFLATLAYRIVCARDNANRERVLHGIEISAAGREQVDLDKSGAAKGDLTDKEDSHFRYSL